MSDWQKRRKMLNLTQRELAALVGISRTALSHIERGKSVPSSKTAANLERVLNPLANPVRLVCGKGALAASEIIRSISKKKRLWYALTLDVPSWLLAKYQTPAAAWAYVRDLEKWIDALRDVGVGEASESERSDLLLLRATESVIRNTMEVEGFRIAPVGQIMMDCAQLSGRHALDAACLYLAFPKERPHGLRLDPAAMIKAWEEFTWT